MAITKGQLDKVVQAWNAYAEEAPRKVKAKDLLEKRDLNMYRGLGISDSRGLARQLVEHRLVATMEMTMGFLYERILQVLGPQKVTLAQKRLTGYKGIDFIQAMPGELRVINLKSGLSTSNGDITEATATNLGRAKRYWEGQRATDDNPLAQEGTRVVMVKAVARGKRKKTTTDEGILWLVGECMWEYFGAGESFLERLSEALGRNPLDYVRFEAEKVRVVDRLVEYLTLEGLANREGEVNWAEMVPKFP